MQHVPCPQGTQTGLEFRPVHVFATRLVHEDPVQRHPFQLPVSTLPAAADTNISNVHVRSVSKAVNLFDIYRLSWFSGMLSPPACLIGVYPAETAPQLCIHGVSCLLQQPLPHLSISADGTPACGARPDIREGREAYPVSSVPVPCTGGGTSPPCGRTTCPGPTWLGTSMLVTRPHTAAGTRAAGGSSLLGRIRTGRMRRVPQGTKIFVILRRIQQWKNGLIPLSTCRTSWPRCRPLIPPTP